jgi:hypothetical protein
MLKYPVVKNGVNYEVVIEEYDSFDYVWIAKLYIYSTIKVFKFSKKNVRHGIYSKFFGIKEHEYTYKNVEYLDDIDFILMANKIVNEYDNKINDETRYENKVKKAIKNFESWDGIVK